MEEKNTQLKTAVRIQWGELCHDLSTVSGTSWGFLDDQLLGTDWTEGTNLYRMYFIKEQKITQDFLHFRPKHLQLLTTTQPLVVFLLDGLLCLTWHSRGDPTCQPTRPLRQRPWWACWPSRAEKSKQQEAGLISHLLLARASLRVERERSWMTLELPDLMLHGWFLTSFKSQTVWGRGGFKPHSACVGNSQFWWWTVSWKDNS